MEFLSSMETTSDSPYKLLLQATLLLPISHYLLGFLFVYLVFVYNFLEFHIIHDFFTGFRGQPVSLTFNSCSELYEEVVSKCQLLHGRYLATPWLSSPHLQTTFLRFFGRPPVFTYTRELLRTSDGGTIALDWLANSDVVDKDFQVNDEVHQDDNAPIVIVIPGLTSDSDSVYIKHLTFYMAKRGWNVVVSNHRGLGGVSLTSDFFYNGGWTEDLRKVVEHLHSKFPGAPLFVVGTSLGANMMVKYLGEDGENILIDGAAAVCCPWDLLLCDRFIGRKLVQRFYDKALAFGLKRYAAKHQEFFSRLSNWEGIEKSRRVREFDSNGTCLVGKFETADIYYRVSSCAGFVQSIKVPLLCLSAMDDPVCTSEALIWDESRRNKNIVLATTPHGGHLGYFEGMDAKSVWWVRAVDEFLTVLNSSSIIQRKKKTHTSMSIPISPSKIYVENLPKKNTTQIVKDEDIILDAQKSAQSSGRVIISVIVPLKKCMDQLSQYSRKANLMLYSTSILTTWPLIGSVQLFFQKKFRSVLSVSRKR